MFVLMSQRNPPMGRTGRSRLGSDGHIKHKLQVLVRPASRPHAVADADAAAVNRIDPVEPRAEGAGESPLIVHVIAEAGVEAQRKNLGGDGRFGEGTPSRKNCAKAKHTGINTLGLIGVCEFISASAERAPELPLAPLKSTLLEATDVYPEESPMLHCWSCGGCQIDFIRAAGSCGGRVGLSAGKIICQADGREGGGADIGFKTFHVFIGQWPVTK